MTARSFLGAGDVYFGLFVNGVAVALGTKVYADKFEITPKSDTKQSTSKGKTDYGQTLESVTLPQPTEFQIDLKEIKGDALAMQFQGTATTLTQTSGTLAATAFTAALGKQIELGHKAFTTIVVTDSAGTTTYVAGTDYLANLDMGWVQPLTGGAITDASSIKVSGSYGAISGTVITGQTNSDIRARIVFDGINKADSSHAQVEIYEAVIAADSGFDFLADDFGNLTLKGTLKTPTSKTTPFTVTTY
jgi:hypothetical protein